MLNVLQEKTSTSRSQRRQEIQAKFDHLWLTEPEQFDPNRSAMERERIERTWSLLAPQVQPQASQLLTFLAAGAFCQNALKLQMLTYTPPMWRNIPLNV